MCPWCVFTLLEPVADPTSALLTLHGLVWSWPVRATRCVMLGVLWPTVQELGRCSWPAVTSEWHYPFFMGTVMVSSVP